MLLSEYNESYFIQVRVILAYLYACTAKIVCFMLLKSFEEEEGDIDIEI